MSTSQNNDPVSMEPVSKETGLVRRSEFLTNRVRELAQQVRALDPADRAGPQDAHAYCKRARLHHERVEYGQAIQDYDEAIRLDPKLAEAITSGGVSSYQRGQYYKHAIQAFDLANRLDPTYAPAYVYRGRMHQLLGNSKEAERDFQKAKELGYPV